MDEEDKDLIESIAKFTGIDSASKFCKIQILKKCNELKSMSEYSTWLIEQKIKQKSIEENLEDE